ncbi:MAG: glutathione S-transferase family protein [Rhodospirillaceae bacterium]|jgi:glutathione S-transferase|nr:glutathione S-transferase family protein [Rhodospirillaceae bacterium]
MDFTLIIGNRNYSSWSLRGWLVMKLTGAAFNVVVIPLDLPESRNAIQAHSAAGKVPILRHGSLTVWDTLAIAEYLAELFPDKHLWPDDTEARARARSVASEMHSGFAALREHLPMDLRVHAPGGKVGPGVGEDISRINTLWTDCRRRFGGDGPFLFGDFCIADAFFAPVVGRFRTYGIELSGEAAAYAEAIWQWPDMQAWLDAANDEPWVIDTLKP